jgi:hypothetical protein
MTPGWILDTLSAVMLVVAGVSAARLAARLAALPPWRRTAAGAGLAGPSADVDAAHLLMGIAMAGMLTASLNTLPDGAWEVIFGIATAWFAWRVYQDARGSGTRAMMRGHYALHLIHGAAMLYMYLALTAPPGSLGGTGMGGMGGMGGASGTMQTLRLPTLALVFALLLAGYTVRDLDLLSGPGGHPLLTPATVALATATPAAAPLPADADPRAPRLRAVATRPRHAPARDDSPATAPDVTAPGGTARARGNLVLSPRLATSCRIAMGITMAFMIVIMI